VVGNTEIETIDGPQKIEDVIRRLKVEDVYVYGFDLSKGRVAISKVLDGGMTRKSADVWRVGLDNGEFVEATGDHRFMRRDGSYVPLRGMRVGESLMPLYLSNVKSHYGTVYTKVDLNNGRRMLAHNLVSMDVFGIQIDHSNLVVHHWDGNGTNNSIGNIDVISRRRHMSIHSRQGWRNSGPERRKLLPSIAKSAEGRRRSKEVNARRKLEWTEHMWEQWRNKISNTRRKRGLGRGRNNGMYGRKHSLETRNKMRLKKIGKKTGKPAWNTGLTKETSESVRKISVANKGRVFVRNRKSPVEFVCEW
jgi:hypothetical protein